jgi:hypothetical protein
MVGHIIATLRRSTLVKDLEIIELVEEESVQLLRVKAEIIDGSALHIREAIFPESSKYSYHWQTREGKLLIRWDNAPHHPEIPTHPDHKHDKEQLSSSSRASVDDELNEISTALRGKEPVR